MTRKNRDNFSQRTIRFLKESVAHRCSNPDCRVPTSASTSDHRINNIGDAAHICAAASGGPRYDPSMTSDERSSIENGIWLCKNCARKIDNDPDKYSVSLLKEWKRKAIESALAELGQKLPSHNDIQNQLIQSLTGHTNNLITKAIPNTHKAHERYLSSLDPRFNVLSKYDGKSVVVELQPKEKVSLSVSYIGTNKREFIKSQRDLIQQGKIFQLSTSQIKVEGSPLIEKIMEDDGVISINPPEINSIIKLHFIHKETKIIDMLDDIHGIISFGTKLFNFIGSTYNDILKFNFGFSCDFKTKSKVSLNINTKTWENININKIPYFNKLMNFIEKICSNEWEMNFIIEIHGDVLATGVLNLDDLTIFETLKTIFLYTKRCRIIAEQLGLNVKFSNRITFSDEEHRKIYEISEILKGVDTEKYHLPQVMSCNLYGDEYLNFIKDINFIHNEIKFVITEQVKIFSKIFELKKLIILENVYLNPNTWKNADGTTTIYIKPSDKFKFDITYKLI